MPSKADVLNEIAQMFGKNGIKEDWSNFTGNLSTQALVLNIDKADQLQEVIRRVHRFNMDLQLIGPPIRIRAAAGWDDDTASSVGWNFSNSQFKNKQESRYNESYSITPSAGEGDIIVRFSKQFQERHYEQAGNRVTVPAGMQIGELAMRMQNSSQPLSLPTVSMIWAVSAVGLAANGGHGTGRDQPGFSGLIKKMVLLDARGDILEITPGFIKRNHGKPEPCAYTDYMLDSHMGIFGIVLNIEIEAEPAFNLEERRYAAIDFNDLKASVPLSDHFKKEYATFMWMPTNDKTPRYEFRHWSRTDELDQVRRPFFAPGKFSREQEIAIQLNKALNKIVYNERQHYLIPLMHRFAAKLSIGSKEHLKDNPDVRVGNELDITHYQVSFPENLMDISMLFPVKDKDIEAFFNWLVETTQSLLSQEPFKKTCPITYAMYARYLKGSGKGLSPLFTEADEHILAFEWVTHPSAPHLSLFLSKLFQKISHNPWAQPRFHLGKFVPNTAHFSTFLGIDRTKEGARAVQGYYGNDQQLRNSPFLTPYIRSQFVGRSQQLLPQTVEAVDAALAPYKRKGTQLAMPVPSLRDICNQLECLGIDRLSDVEKQMLENDKPQSETTHRSRWRMCTTL